MIHITEEMPEDTPAREVLLDRAHGAVEQDLAGRRVFRHFLSDVDHRRNHLPDLLESTRVPSAPVIPAKAGIQAAMPRSWLCRMDPGFRRGDARRWSALR
jgi:hypothetical protein